VTSLLVSATRQPAAGAAGQLPSTERIAIALPDRYTDEIRSELPGGFGAITNISGLMGKEGLERSSVRGNRIIHDGTSEAREHGEEQFARALMLWLLRDSPAVPVTWSAGTPGKNVPSNRLAVQARGRAGFNATLWLDAETCHPIAVSYERPANLGDMRAEQASGVTALGDTRLVRLDMGEYRSFGGVQFPTVIRMSVSGRAEAEQRVTDIEVNPVLPGDYFTKPIGDPPVAH
jgi:hypothetical protein